jgi:hypothetical protein
MDRKEDFPGHLLICQILGVSMDELFFETEDSKVDSADILYIVWDHMIEYNMMYQKRKWKLIVSVVYSRFLHSEIPTMTDVLEAASRGGDIDLIKSMMARTNDIPSNMREWVVEIPGLMYVDDDRSIMASPNRIGQMQNAAWACEADDGYRYWPEGSGEGFNPLIDLLHKHYTIWLEGKSDVSSDDIDMMKNIEDSMNTLLSTSNNYITKRLVKKFASLYA